MSINLDRLSGADLVRHAPLSGGAVAAAFEVFPDALFRNVVLYQSRELVEFFLSRLADLPGDQASVVVHLAMSQFDPEVVASALERESRVEVLRPALSVLSRERRTQLVGNHPSLAEDIFTSSLSVDVEAIWGLAARNNAGGQQYAKALLVASAIDDLEVGDAAELLANAAEASSRHLRAWDPMLAFQEILLRPGVLRCLASGRWSGRIPDDAIVHLLVGPFFGDDRLAAEEILSRELTAERLSEVPDWLQTTWFWYGTTGLSNSSSLRRMLRDWAESNPHFRSDARAYDWMDEASELLLARLESDAAPFSHDPDGFTAEELGLTAGGARGSWHPSLPGIGAPWSSDLEPLRLSESEWAQFRAATRLIYWGQVAKVSGYQALKVFYPPLLLGLFSEVLSDESFSQVAAELAARLDHVLLPMTLAVGYGVASESSVPLPPRAVNRPEVVEVAWQEISETIGEDSSRWFTLLELCDRSGLPVSSSLPIVT